MKTLKCKNQTIPLILLALCGFGFLDLLVVSGIKNIREGELIAQQATTIEQITAADERMERSRTNYDRPGITRAEVDMIEAVAKDYGMPPELLYAFRRQENGGRGLYLGAVSISPEIRKRYPPLWWQFAQGAKIWDENLNKNVLGDPYLRQTTLRRFAKQWYSDNPDVWADGVLSYLPKDKDKTLRVTEPPEKVKGGKHRKAKGGGQKPLRHALELSR